MLFYEDLTDVVPVGHSYGGNVITGVADQVPVVHAQTARVWAVQRRFHVRQQRHGYGRVLAELP